MENKINIGGQSSVNHFKESKSPVTSKFILEHSEVDDPKSSKKSLSSDDVCQNVLETMKYEKNRLSSFEGKWPLQFINVIDLAKAGFFYLQLDDRVQCAYCGLVLYDWKNGDHPLEIHIKNSPRCIFLVSSRDTSKQASLVTSVDVPEVSTGRLPLSYCNKISPIASGSNSHRPKKPHMSDIRRRLSTFGAWPLTNLTADKLADCGFYYTGIADVVTCFFCGGSLGSWEPSDDPMVEHYKFYPNCGYLRLLCNRPVQNKSSAPKPSINLMNNSEQPIKQTVASEFLKSDIIREAKEIFPPSLVHDVVLQYLRETGQVFTSLNQLCEKIMELEENRLRRNAETKDKQSYSKVPNIKSAENLTSIKDSFLCKICMDREMGIVFQPCGHLVTCEKCADVISDCPLCRRKIETRVRTYLS